MKRFTSTIAIGANLNRPLLQYEKRNHLLQKERSPDPPWFQLSVIKMNSTFLECPERYFLDKGIVSLGALIAGGMFSFVGLGAVFMTTMRWSTYTPDQQSEWFFATLFACTIAVINAWINIYFLKKEMYRYTHYPMRFNRKTRKVYCFRDDGTIMTEDWDKLFFCTTPMRRSWGVQFHRLAEDGDTVLETFELPHIAEKENDLLTSQWEFVRRFMEEGPKELADQVDVVMDIADRRETFWNGFQRLMANFVGPVATAIFSPLGILFAISRRIAMLSCIVPRWPAEIEAECAIEPNDPYIRDRDHLAPFGSVPVPKFLK